MTSDLVAFNTKVATYVSELEHLQQRNKQDLAFQPTFWLQHADFALARDVLVAAAGSIGHQVTKFSLVYSKTPSKEEGASICEALEHPCEQLLAATKVALFCGAGPSLANEIINESLRLMKSVYDLGKAIEAHEVSRVPQLTGRVWEYSVSRVSKSNCVASKRSMLQCVTMLNSTLEELKEFLEEQEQDNAAAALDQVETEDDEFTFDSSLSAEERTLFESGLKLLTMASAILKRGVQTLKKLTIEDNQKEFLAWTSKLDVNYRTIQDAVVDLGAALYPPVGIDDLTEAVDALEKAGKVTLSCLLAQPEILEIDTQELTKGQRAFDHQVATVRSQIEASR